MQHILRPKGVRSSDGGDDFLGKRSSLGDVFERFLHVLGDELVHESKRHGNHGDNGGHGKGEFPLLDKGDYETGEESGYETGGHRDLLGDALLYEI